MGVFTVIGFSFFVSTFATFIWLIFCSFYMLEKLHGVDFLQLGLFDLSLYVAIAVLPVLMIWTVFSHVNNYVSTKINNKKLSKLFEQLKRNQDYSDLIARALIESEQGIRAGFALSRLDLVISEINEILSEIILRAKIAPEAEVQEAWFKVTNGEKWALGKIVVNHNMKNVNFSKELTLNSNNDSILAGSILDLQARYNNLLKFLEKYDRDNIFQDSIEKGILGKVLSIILPVADTIKAGRSQTREPYFSPSSTTRQDSMSTINNNIAKPKKQGGLKSIFSSKKKKENLSKKDPVMEKDAFSQFLETNKFDDLDIHSKFSFNKNATQPKTSPIKEKSEEDANIQVAISSPTKEPSKTELALDNLKKERKEIERFASKDISTEIPKFYTQDVTNEEND